MSTGKGGLNWHWVGSRHCHSPLIRSTCTQQYSTALLYGNCHQSIFLFMHHAQYKIQLPKISTLFSLPRIGDLHIFISCAHLPLLWAPGSYTQLHHCIIISTWISLASEPRGPRTLWAAATSEAWYLWEAPYPGYPSPPANLHSNLSSDDYAFQIFPQSVIFFISATTALDQTTIISHLD